MSGERMFNKVLRIFREISEIPRGSTNTKLIADYCESFAKKYNLEYIRDNADNLIIFKDATADMLNAEPVILQGHLDMVCQVSPDSQHNFLENGPEIIIDGDFLKANKTTLGADDGIGVAVILAILESDNISHPPIEAVLTSDEEIGMIGATALDMSRLKSKRMINLDGEEDDTITVSCAGGSDFKLSFTTEYEAFSGTQITIRLFGLKGGHSGVDIDKCRVNANVLAGRVLNHLYNDNSFRIVAINGGDKCNAITTECKITLITQNKNFVLNANPYLCLIKDEISTREPEFNFEILANGNSDFAFSKSLTEKTISLLVNAPNGIMQMSAEIEGLVETSLNLGILKTCEETVSFQLALRSNKMSAMQQLVERLVSLSKLLDASYESFGHYPPWEYNANSDLQEIYTECFTEHYGFPPKIKAIHAGLECGVFDSQIEGLTAIAVGPQMYDVHTVNERLSISSTEKFCELILKVLKRL